MIRSAFLVMVLAFVLIACSSEGDVDSIATTVPESTPTEVISQAPTEEPEPAETPAPSPTPELEPTQEPTPLPTLPPVPTVTPELTLEPEAEPTPDFVPELDDAEMDAIFDELEYWLRITEPFERFARSAEQFVNSMDAPDEAWDDPGFRQAFTFTMAEWGMIYQDLSHIQPPDIFEAEHVMMVQGFGYLNRASEQLWEPIWQDGAEEFDESVIEQEGEQGFNDLFEGFELIEEAMNRMEAIMDEREAED